MTKTYKNILFDLDGTLTDSAPGIVTALKYAFCKMNTPCPDTKVLHSYIGPPLPMSLCKHFSLQDLDKAVAYTREYYLDKGKFDSSVFEGIPKLLQTLKSLGYNLYVATCKGIASAREILAHYGLADFFIFIQGIEEGLNNKSNVIEKVVTQFNLQAKDTLFVGDTLHDTIGAKENNIDMCFVTYGYGKQESVANMPVVCYAPSPSAVLEFLQAQRL